MKKLFSLLLLALFAVSAFGQNTSKGPVYKVITSGATKNDITEDLNIPSGRTLKIKSGGTLDANGATIIGLNAGYATIFGTGAPSDATGNDGDAYVNKSNGAFYKKASGTWGAAQLTLQLYDADLDLWGAITPSANMQSLAAAANYAAMKSLLTINNVDNTADTAKPVSTAQQTALNLKLNAANGNPTGITTNAAGLVIAPASTSTVLTVTAPDNFHTFSTAPTYTLSINTPTAGTHFWSRHTNTSGSALLVTLPAVSVYSTNHGSAATSFTFWIGAGNTENLHWFYDSANSRFIVDGIPTPGYGPEYAQTAASTTDLWQSSLNQTITGTTTITSFGSTAPAGTRVNLRFLAATPITYNATSMIIPGSVSRTAAVGDLVEAVHLGSGNWQLNWVKRDGTALVASTSRLGSHATPDTTGGALTWTSAMHIVYANTTTTYALPAAAGYDGRSVIFFVTGTNALTIDPNASEVIVRSGTAQTGGVTLTLTGAAGNYVVLVCDGTRWITFGYVGTLAAGS